MKAMTFKKVKEIGGEYMRLQFAVAQAALKVKDPIPHKSLKEIQAFRDKLEGRHLGYYFNLVRIGNAFNDLLRDCLAQNDKIAKGFFMLLSSDLKSLDANFITEMAKRGMPYQENLDIIPPRDAGVWRDLIVRDIIKPMMVRASGLAVIRLLQNLYAPKDISFDGLVKSFVPRERLLAGIKTIAADSPDAIPRVEKVCGNFNPWTASSYDISREDVLPEERHFKTQDITSADIRLNWVDLSACIRERKFPSAVLFEDLPPTDKKEA